MKILVPVKRVVDHQISVRVNAEGTGLELDGLRMILNPFDEIALEEAVRLREAGVASEVLVVACGPAATQDMLRNALAMGADRAVLIETDLSVQPLGAAKLLKALALRETPELVLMGKQAVDDDACQTGQMLAAMLGWPQGCFASKIQVGLGHVQVTREVDGGLEMLELDLPALVTADLRLNEPRFVTLANLMKARKKAIEIIPANDLGVDFAPRLQIERMAAPPERAPGLRLNSVLELAGHLRPWRAEAQGGAV